MPKIGIVCPVREEQLRAANQPDPVGGARVPDQVCLDCCAGDEPRFGRWCRWPYEALAAMVEGDRRKTAYVSATMLSNVCQRQAWLEQRLDYHVRPKAAFPGVRGNMGHFLMEEHPEPGSFYEVRFEIRLPGIPVPVTGQMDKCSPRRKRLTDFKSKLDKRPRDKPGDEVPAEYGLEGRGLPQELSLDYVRQAAVYRFLLWYGSPQVRVEADRYGNPLRRPDGSLLILEPGVPAQLEIEEIFFYQFHMGDVGWYNAARMDFETTRAYIYERALEILADEVPEVPADLEPMKSRFCLEWCPYEVREACLRLRREGLPDPF